MKRLAVVLIVAVASFCLAGSAFAGNLAPGQMTKCNNAGSITLENAGGGGVDRGEANASVWKSSNFTTVAISLSPNANNGFPGNGGGSAGNAKVHMTSKHSMGQNKVVLNSQTNFSRGDSIGDISGEVRITNTGTVGINVNCG
ncbi:MAG: hypothetical protein HOH38_04855 [Nitrospinaceae bacterium]|nr:hypothetical protein [Nitrospina sp.]MBT5868149.1 hypothetical protein [Nitrospinaceae bacterium]MBT6346650.1 hypothetical protein [Nitrospina sp.]